MKEATHASRWSSCLTPSNGQLKGCIAGTTPEKYTDQPQHQHHWQVMWIAVMIALQCNVLLSNLESWHLSHTTHTNIVVVQPLWQWHSQMAVRVTGGTTSLCMTWLWLWLLCLSWSSIKSERITQLCLWDYTFQEACIKKRLGVHEMWASNRKKTFKEKDAIVFIMGNPRSSIFLNFNHTRK